MLEICKLTKDFGSGPVVKGVEFSASAGEVLGFLGPNGAGKSTTMKMICGFLPPSSGDAKICGHSIRSEAVQAQTHLGYVPENAPLYEEMPVLEFLDFIAQMRSLSGDYKQQRIETVVRLCALGGVLEQKIETLSKGFKRRVSLAQALLHDPKVLILDEPTDGLDPNQKHDVRELIRQLAKEKCLLISTHILEEVEEICDRCIIISEGEIRFTGSPQELKNKSEQGRINDVFRAMTTGQVVQGVSL